MHAIILAAGKGSRFQPEPLPYPKCLIRFGGKSLLARSIENLAWAGCDAVTVVVGYRADLIEREIGQRNAALPKLKIDVRHNPNYEGGSAGSLLCAADILENEPTLMLDSDILYDRGILSRVMQAADDNVILVEQKEASNQIEYWVTAQNSRVVKIAKSTHRPKGAVGVYWGVHKISPAFGKRFVDLGYAFVQANSGTEYWYVVPKLLQQITIGYVDTAGMIYYEMDTWQEVEWGRSRIYPQLVALGQS